MTVEIIRNFLAWCSVINVGVLIYWWLFFTLAHGFVYRIQGKWFKLSVEKFDAIHYTGIAFFKMSIILFNIVPYIALRIVG
ncbi:MAG: hypothetical protein E4H21_08465 [Thermodesulfobacteriales bacterium]|jgi:hypothetical protein|nr:MAG: hypothetical protein E4H21_08465 [Thermodesulfobacteriales bacterium]